LGKKYNKRGLFLLIGMIVQVLVFSAAHANYPQQPYYFRLVELIGPSLLFAFAYIYFGCDRRDSAFHLRCSTDESFRLALHRPWHEPGQNPVLCFLADPIVVGVNPEIPQ
jgi:hypothetical protein